MVDALHNGAGFKCRLQVRPIYQSTSSEVRSQELRKGGSCSYEAALDWKSKEEKEGSWVDNLDQTSPEPVHFRILIIVVLSITVLDDVEMVDSRFLR